MSGLYGIFVEEVSDWVLRLSSCCVDVDEDAITVVGLKKKFSTVSPMRLVYTL